MPAAELPSFRYHPDPVATGAVEAMSGTCRCCGEDRGWICVVTPYATADLQDGLCPWCIADGSAAQRFDARFNHLHDGAPPTDPLRSAPPEALDVIAHRTPGFSAWQQEHWMFCCGDGAAFLGAVGWDELVAHPGAIAALRAQVAGWGFDDEDVSAFMGSLDTDGSSTAYLFRCLHCRTHLAYADTD